MAGPTAVIGVPANAQPAARNQVHASARERKGNMRYPSGLSPAGDSSPHPARTILTHRSLKPQTCIGTLSDRLSGRGFRRTRDTALEQRPPVRECEAERAREKLR